MAALYNLTDCIEVETAPHPTHSIIWLHGLGAEGSDFLSMVSTLRLNNSLAIRFIFPHAPQQPVTINGGMIMRAWYDIRVVDLVRQEDRLGIEESERHLKNLIARENTRGVPTSNIVLGGFSQGCAMILHTGLRLPEKLAGLVGLSGYLPLIDLVKTQHLAANIKTPIFLAHGTHDTLVPFSRAQAGRDVLQDLGQQVQWHTYPIEHSVCTEEIAEVGQFLREVLK